MEITSINNELVKTYAKLQQKKYRNESDKFILEGYKAIKEAYDFGINIEKIFIDKKHLSDYDFLPEEIVIETNEIVLKKLSSTESPPPAVAIAAQKKYKAEDFKNLKKIILLEGIKDLGNLGTIIRSAAAFGCDGIVLYGDCADIYNPKCVRSAVGNLWKLPIIYVDNFNQLEKMFNKYTKIATLPRSNNNLKNFNLQTPSVIMFGSEADGLSHDLQEFATDNIRIEMEPDVESLNLASSVSIIMYELFTD